ncbi:MAG: ParB/RepB/Spo0J family partition protein [Helicobacteraceae bacterium]|nr:ParB/RepB/Spo0J family partition protein [Helicobacteraceae bacterium]
MAKRATLGRGIGAILDEVEEAYAADIRGNTEAILILEIDEIAPNPFQPRKRFDDEALADLAASIKQHGLLQPIVVFEKDGKFVLIAGERRLKASRLAGLNTIRAIVADINYSKLRELALIENIQRQDLNPLELAESFNELIAEHNLTHEALADLVGKSRAYITNMLRLLQLGEYAKEAIASEKISYGHGKILVGLSERDERKLVDSIVNQKLAVRETEALLQSIRREGGVKNLKPIASGIDLSDLVAKLKAQGFAARGKRNDLVISFNETDDRDRFARLIEKQAGAI